MSDIEIRVLGEDDWQTFRDVRLRALQDAPTAFTSTYAEEEALPEAEWRAKMQRSARLIATDDEDVVGVVSLRTDPGLPTGFEVDDLKAAEVFGLWVEPGHRGIGTPIGLVNAAADLARANELTHLIYWAGVDNARAVGFASGYGFRPTDSRRPARTGGEEGGAEAAMVFPLAR